MMDTPEEIAHDIAAIGRISAVPVLLRILCQNTGMGFAAVARVTEGTWTACAVQDNIGFGLMAGGQLDVQTTLCREARTARQPVVIDHASQDPVYHDHHTPRLYGIESYVSVPIVLSNGDYFGNLCAIDPRPANVSRPQTVAMFTAYAELIGQQLEREDHQEAVETALLQERERAELREQFIAVLGHDLRNPLMAVSASAEMMVRRPSLIDVAAVGRRIGGSARRMSRLIDDVMDFARGRLGSAMNLHLALEPDVGVALHDVVAELRESNPGHPIVADIGVHLNVFCDRSRLQQLLSNLMANALHHGAAHGTVRVEVAVVEALLRLSVTNQGPPIAPEDLGRIFEPYWRPASSQPGGGLGLGLHICAQIVSAHGGSLEVTSSAEAGTCFVAQVPVGAAG